MGGILVYASVTMIECKGIRNVNWDNFQCFLLKIFQGMSYALKKRKNMKT